MKREFLKSIEGLTDEAIDKIMAEVGKDIEATKAKADKSQEIENLQSQLKEKDTQLANVNSEIEKFKGMNIEEIQKQVETLKTQNVEYETKSKADKEAFETQLKQQAYDFKLSEAVGQLKFPNELTKKAFMGELKTKNLPLEGEKILGFEDYIKEIGDQNPGMFVVEEAETGEKPLPNFTTGNTNQTTPTETGFNFNFTPVNKQQ